FSSTPLTQDKGCDINLSWLTRGGKSHLQKAKKKERKMEKMGREERAEVKHPHTHTHTHTHTPYLPMHTPACPSVGKLEGASQTNTHTHQHTNTHTHGDTHTHT